MLSFVARDFRLAARRLRAAPLFTLFAVVSLAVGIGVTTVAYSIVERLFFSDVGVADPARVALVGTQEPGRVLLRSALSQSDFDALQPAPPSFSTLTASSSFLAAVGVPGGQTELVLVEAVAPHYFPTVGVEPTLGRPIQQADEASGAPVAIVGHEFWRRHFSSDTNAIGQAVRVGGQSFDVVGIMPDSYRGRPFAPWGRTADVWIPLAAARNANADLRLTVFGRLRPDSTIERAAAEIGGRATALDASNPQTPSPQAGARPRGWTARTFADLHADQTGPMRRLGIVVAGLVLMVLLVSCTNLANLVLARGTNRHQEFAVRRALGAGRWRLVREQLTESVLIAAGGGVAAYLVMRAVVAFLPRNLLIFMSQTVALETVIDPQMLLIAVVALLVSLVVFGLEPAIQLTRSPDVRGQLAAAAGGVALPKQRRHRMLVRWQVAVSTAFFILAAITINAVFAELRHDSGIDLEPLVIAHLDFDAQRWDEEHARRVLDRVLAEARNVPELASVDVSTGMPFGTSNPRIELSTPDRPPVANGNAPVGILVASTTGFFRTIGVPIVRGRAFDERDHAAASPVVVVSETTAQKLFGTTDVVGRQLLTHASQRGASAPARAVTIAGVAGDTDTFFYMGSRGGLVVYAPFTQHFNGAITVIGRAGAGTRAPVGALEAAIRRGDPDLAIAAIGTGPEVLGGPYRLIRTASTASLSLGLLTLAMSMVGLYGVQSLAVGRRTREIGVRMSFGATTAQVKRMVLKDGYRPVLEGMAIGLFMGVAGRTIVRVFLNTPIAILDPWMLAVVPVPMIFAAFCACYLPARRAAAIDPMVALRDL
jgi:putative ABC transport system permease protein